MPATLRPEFHWELRLSKQEFEKKLQQRLQKNEGAVVGLVAEGRVELHAREAHLSAPQLIVEYQAEADGLRLHGRFGPHPSVWTLFMAIYAGLGLAFMVSSCFAFAQWMLEQPATALLVAPLALLGAGLTRWAGVRARKHHERDMLQLRNFLAETLELAEHFDANTLLSQELYRSPDLA